MSTDETNIPDPHLEAIHGAFQALGELDQLIKEMAELERLAPAAEVSNFNPHAPVEFINHLGAVWPARIVATDVSGPKPIAALIKNVRNEEVCWFFEADGYFNKLEHTGRLRNTGGPLLTKARNGEEEIC